MNEGYLTEFRVLIDRIAPTHYWTKEQVSILAEELYMTLRCKALLLDPMTGSLPYKLDLCWHELILETELYARFCKDKCGGVFLHHTKRTVDDSDDKKRERINLLFALRTTTSHEVPVSMWCWDKMQRQVGNTEPRAKRLRPGKEVPKILVYIKFLDGEVITLHVPDATTVWAMKGMVYDAMNKDGKYEPDAQRFIHHGVPMDDDKPCAHYVKKDGDTIHLVLRLRGC